MTAEIFRLHSPAAVQRVLAGYGIVFPERDVPVSDVALYFVAPEKPEVVTVRCGPNGYDLWTSRRCPHTRKVDIKDVRHVSKWLECLPPAAAEVLRAA